MDNMAHEYVCFVSLMTVAVHGDVEWQGRFVRGSGQKKTCTGG